MSFKSHYIARFVSFLGVLLLSLQTGLLSANETSAKSNSSRSPADVRLLIDISGSMKKNDPGNLRIPAVNLLTELIPDGDKSGVWTFGQWVNHLIQHQVVNDKWRVGAKENAKKINSVALYTNIGAVLEKASDDFYKEGDFSNTHFILLTDGMVDIDRDTEKNTRERDRILSTVLDTFKERGAKIHSISLSKNADRSLMDKLAIQTGGQSAVAETPEELTRIFVQALEQAVPSEQVPIEGNEFVIDSSIEEFTALIFRGDDGAATSIVGPDEQLHSQDKHSDDVSWYQDKGYDLITVKRPLEGAWTINANIESGSRVTVVSNLKLMVNKLPVNFFAGDHLAVEVSFAEDGRLVTNKEFLSLMEVTLNLKTEDNKQGSKVISDPAAPPEDGVFRDAIRKLTKVGQYELTVLVDGKTFKRKNRQIINLRSPFDFEFSVKGVGDQAHYELVASPLTDNLSIENTSVFAKIKAPDDTSLIKAVELDADAKRWVLPITPDKGDGMYKVAVKVKGKTAEGKEFEFKPKVFEAEFPIPASSMNQIVSVNEASEQVDEEQEEESAEEPVVQPESAPEKPAELENPAEPKAEEPVVEEASEVVETEESGTMFWAGIAAAVLSLISLIAGGIFFLRKKKQKEAGEGDAEILSDEVVDEIMDEETVSEPEISDELDFVEEPEPAPEPKPEPEQEPELDEWLEEDDAFDLANENLDDVVEGLERDEADQDVAVELSAEDEEDLASRIAEAIMDTPDESEDALAKEEEEALDINDADDDDDDEEFNLEDFDISDTDDLFDEDDKK